MSKNRIIAQIKPNSRHKQGVFEVEGRVLVYVKSPATEGKANTEAIDVLAKHLNISKTKLKLIRGAKSKLKTFEY